MASNALKYGARASALGLFTWGVVAWNTARTLQEQAVALMALGVALCILAPTLPRDYRPPMYAFGGAVLVAGVGLWLVAENSDQRAALGSGVHDGRTAGNGGGAGNSTREITAVDKFKNQIWFDWRDMTPPLYRLFADSAPDGSTVLSVQPLLWIAGDGSFTWGDADQVRLPRKPALAQVRDTLAPLVDLMDPGAQVGAATPDPLNASYVAVLAQVAGEDGVEIEQIDLFDFILKFKTMSDDRVKELEAVN